MRTEERLQHIEELLLQITVRLDAHLKEEEEMAPKIGELLELFSHAKGVLSFIKVCAAVGTFFAGTYIFFRDVFNHIK